MRIGKKVRVDDIRRVWKKENDFSDWLVSDDGLAFLAEELGIEIENLTRESRLGEFQCDIVGNLLGDEQHIVVMEVQFGKTNHDHLGKLLTYSAVHKAMTAIWISETISDDHRQVIDWLNENTPTNVNLYLVGLKLFRIGDSEVAPQLDVVCRPNTKVKETMGVMTPAEEERREWRRSMWEQIHEAIRASKPQFRLQKPGCSHWSSIAIGRSGFSLNMLLNTKNKNIGVELYVRVPWKMEAFKALESQRAVIEEEIGTKLDWQFLPGKKSFRILLETKIDPKEEQNLEALKRWFVENTVRMHTAFKDRIARVDGPDPGVG